MEDLSHPAHTIGHQYQPRLPIPGEYFQMFKWFWILTNKTESLSVAKAKLKVVLIKMKSDFRLSNDTPVNSPETM